MQRLYTWDGTHLCVLLVFMLCSPTVEPSVSFWLEGVNIGVLGNCNVIFSLIKIGFQL